MRGTGAERSAEVAGDPSIGPLADVSADWLSDAGRKAQNAQFEALLEETPDTTIIVDPAGRVRYASRRIETMFGYLPSEVCGKPLDLLIPERDRGPHANHVNSFMKDPRPRMMRAGRELRALRKNGSEFAAEISLSPHATPDGLVVVAAVRDLEATKRAQRFLLKELHHRLKNTLATVTAITSQSLRSARNLEEGRLAVESRLTALGRAHDLLLEEESKGARLRDVIDSAVSPFDRQVNRFSVRSVDLRVLPEAVLPLAMSINELCTNALKYGALSNTAGHIDITCTVDEVTQRFKFTWTERAGPPVHKPTRHSFGTRLIGHLAKQLQGGIHVQYTPGGVCYELDIPLTNFSLPESDAG